MWSKHVWQQSSDLTEFHVHRTPADMSMVSVSGSKIIQRRRFKAEELNIVDIKQS